MLVQKGRGRAQSNCPSCLAPGCHLLILKTCVYGLRYKAKINKYNKNKIRLACPPYDSVTLMICRGIWVVQRVAFQNIILMISGKK